jgi:heme A synthase
MEARTASLSKLAVFAWFVLAFSLVVIVWGAFVRASGSGAGCGGHWPLCNGEVVPLAPKLATVIEFTHRMMSGLSLVLVAILAIWAFRVTSKGHPVRRGAAASLAFMITEALIGAALVLFGWVAGNASVARTISTSLHLLNTFCLLAAMALTAWWASGGTPLRLRRQGNGRWMLGLALLGVMVVGLTGVISALGDTLFPARSLSSGLAQDVAPTAHFLVRLRMAHPVLAVAVGAYLFYVGSLLHDVRWHLDRYVRVLLLAQVGAGALNMVLLAPTWLQLVHLLLADLIWIGLVLLSATVLAAGDSPPLLEATRFSVPSGTTGE